MFAKRPLIKAFFLLTFSVASVLPVYGQTGLLPQAEFQAINANGQPLSGGMVYTYVAGTTTPQATYTDSSGNTPNPNPVILDTAGRASIWISNGAYKVVVTDANGVVQYSQDNVTNLGGGVTAPVQISAGGTGLTTAGTPLQVLRVSQTGTSLQYGSIPLVSSKDYNFPAQSPGGSLSVGSNTITLTPCPLGVSGTDTNHFFWISGGTGTPESVLMTGGTCTSGAASGTVIVGAANTHSGAWTIASATAGIQEAVCAAAGGPVTIPPGTYAMQAAVLSCGYANPTVAKQAGATLTGGYGVFQSNSTGTTQQETFTAPVTGVSQSVSAYGVATATGLSDLARYSVNNFPFTNEFQGTATPTTQALVGATNTTTAGTTGTPVVGIGSAGYAWTNAINENAVGMYAAGQLNSETTSPNTSSAWGANFLATNYGSSGVDGNAFDGNIYGLELDVNILKTSGLAKPISNVNGLWVAGASSTNQQVGYSRALHVGQLGIGAHIPWDAALYTDDNAAQIGASLGTTTVGNGVGSQSLQLRTRTSGGTDQTETMQADQFGDITLTPAAQGQVVLSNGSGVNMLQTVPPNANIQANVAIQLATTLGQNTCNSTHRGEIYIVRGNGAGTSDSLQVCIETTTGTFAWHVVIPNNSTN